MSIDRWLLHPVSSWRKWHNTRLQQGLEILKYRYQIFRALLEDNHRAITLLTEIGAKLRSGTLSLNLSDKVSELNNVVGEMIEKQEHLTSTGMEGLTRRYLKISAEIDRSLKTIPRSESYTFCLALQDIEPDMLHAVGGKSATLAALKKTGSFHVPEGFVITASACRFFLENKGIMLSMMSKFRPFLEQKQIPGDKELEEVRQLILTSSLPASLSSAVREISEPYFKGPHPIAFAVRSSALSEDSNKHSFAGQYQTVLNVSRIEDLLQAVKRVIASSFSSRNISYRLHAGLDPVEFDLAVLCLEMIDAECSGTMFTRDPNNPNAKEMLISAVFGLGELAVSGSGNTDIYYPSRFGHESSQPFIARKEQRIILRKYGGTVMENLPEEKHNEAVLSWKRQAELVQAGIEIEKNFGAPQDIEWAFKHNGQLVILQSRPFRLLSGTGTDNKYSPTRETLLQGGMASSRGEGIGKAQIVLRRDDLKKLPDEPIVLVLHQSMPDAVEVLDRVAAVVVDLGNPLDHLSCVAREYGVPMLTGIEHATRRIPRESWIVVNANEGEIFLAQEEESQHALREHRHNRPRIDRHERIPMDPAAKDLYESIIPLHLTDAYGPTFSIQECQSLHDIIRYIHEKAVMAMFESGDDLIELSGTSVRHLRTEVPFFVSMIDLGGGLSEQSGKGRFVTIENIRSTPFSALWRGVMTPGLHWGPPAGEVATGGVLSNWMTDHRAARPIGMPNYAIITRDYLNLNARMDFHFIMVDALCGLDPRSNYVRFRFKGGGTTLAQRRRRILCIAEILEANGFLCNVQEDLITASLHGGPSGIIEEKLVMVGRLLGFTRLLDSAMVDDASMSAVSRAFLEGNYGIDMIINNPAISQA
ncbi:MAG: PEP/pyruvate-binding domain-containing protein [Desulfobulbales bacterium]